ncbi:MAG: BadF/BadG/BcrA/BcrD ATPase family protein, partial [Candidatus Aminicenantes bacterium]
MSKILGVDIGSLTIKAATYSPMSAEVEELEVANHRRQPFQRALNLIERVLEDQEISGLAFTGDSGESFARVLNAYYVNPHLASAEANMRFFPHLRTILNIGAASSNLILICEDNSGNPMLDDIVLPPHCSAGTGSFLNQSASRFGCSTEEFGRLALKSKNPENISGTCAVFAGSDMIDKQQKGARKEDIAAGLHYALIKYLIGTLCRGKKLEGPYSFQGGVAENLGMVRAVEDILGSVENPVKVFIPRYHRSMSAVGAAIQAGDRMAASKHLQHNARIREYLQKARKKMSELTTFKDVKLPPLELNDKITIRRRAVDGIPSSEKKIPVYVGIDVGSVSTGGAVLYFADMADDNG